MINLNEIYRYMGIKSGAELSAELEEKILKIVKNAELAAEFKTVSKYYDITFETDGGLDLGFCKVRSKGLKKNLCGCKRVLLYAATLGMNYEKKLSFYSESSPFEALVWHAAGTQLLEEKTDLFLKEKSAADGISFKPGFSPGYGDLPLELQKDIFAALKPEKYIGAYLTASHLMVPSKTITAFAGVLSGDKKTDNSRKTEKNKCALCKNKNCGFRKEG